jgi:hypothetical protein
VECDVGMFRKIPAIQAYIQPRRHKTLQIKRKKLLTECKIHTFKSMGVVCRTEKLRITLIQKWRYSGDGTRFFK